MKHIMGEIQGEEYIQQRNIFQVNNQIAIKNKQKNSKVAFKIANSDI